MRRGDVAPGRVRSEREARAETWRWERVGVRYAEVQKGKDTVGKR